MKTQRRMRTLLVAIALVAPLSGCPMHGKPKVERHGDAVPGFAARAGTPFAGTPAGATVENAALASIVAPGIVEPWGGLVDLSAQEPGWIARVLVKEGDYVLEGQLLATLEDAAQRHSVELARAEVAEAEAILLRVERGATVEELRQAQADHDGAVARAGFARAAAERIGKLHLDGTVPDNEADRAATEARVEAAAAERATARLEEIERGAEPEDRDAARAGVAAARARLALAEANVARRRILAPNSGTVLTSRYHPGEFYSPAAGPLFVLGDMTRLQVRLEVDEIDAPDVRVGAPCVLSSDAGQPLAQGTIVRVAPRMGRRALPLESPTARADVRVREVFVEVPPTVLLIPGQRVWGRTSRP